MVLNEIAVVAVVAVTVVEVTIVADLEVVGGTI